MNKWPNIYGGPCSKTHLLGILLLDFQLWWLAVSMPVEVGKSYIPQKKALLPIVWKKFWDWENFCHGWLQTSFSKTAVFLDFKLKRLAISMPVKLGKSYIHQKKAVNIVNENSFETGRISVMRSSRWVLV